jgi:hypothetical protein
LQEYRGRPQSRPPSPPKTPSSFLPSAMMASLEEHLRHRSGRRTGWSLLAIRYVFISSHRYFVPSLGETLSRALSSYGEEIPNPGLRVCFTNLRFKSILGVSGG